MTNGVLNVPPAPQRRPSEPEKQEVDLYINFIGNVNQATIAPLMQLIEELSRYTPTGNNLLKKAKTIRLFMNSNGGSQELGNSFYHFIKSFKNDIPIHTYNLGFVDSAAVPMFCSGKERFALENSRFVIHEATMEFKGELKRLKETVIGGEDATEKSIAIIASTCNKATSSVKKDFAHYRYLSANKAKEYGLVNIVIKDLPKPKDEDIVRSIMG